MNKRRSEPAENRINMSSIFWILLVITCVATAGIYCGYLKNEGINIDRLIRIQEDLKTEYENQAHEAEAKIHDHLGYFEIKNKLSALQSNLVPITPQQVILIPYNSDFKPLQPGKASLASIQFFPYRFK